MPATVSPHGPSRLDGLDAGRVLDMVMGPAVRERREVPTAEELGALLPEYEVQKVIGRGGMGAVYRAVQRKLARPVAIKVLPVETGDVPGFADRFRREAMTAAGLVHPDIVAVHDTGETVAGHHYYVMDLVDGEDLAQRMERGRLPVEESVALLAAVCGAVEAAHARGIVHRDIKPSNILLTKEGKPKLADFGLALLTEKHLEYSRLTLGGTTLGTLEYAAPEQLAGGAVTVASDQYSLGVLAYELLTGELPRGVFDPPSVRNREVDTAFDGVVLRALQSDPARRYGDVAGFRTALLQAADHRAQQEFREKDARRKLRRRTMIAAAAAAVAVGTVVLAYFAWQQRQRAIAGETEAKTQRDATRLTREEAEKLVEFMLTELQGRLFEVNRLDVLEAVVARVEAYYASVPEAEQQDDGFLRRKAEFIELRGALQGKQDRPDEELALYQEAQAIRTRLLERHPRDRMYADPYCDGESALAHALTKKGRHEDAVASYQRVIDAMLTHYGTGGEASGYQPVLMSQVLQADSLVKLNRDSEAQVLAERTLTRLEEVLRDPDKAAEFAWQNVKAVVLRHLANAAAKRQDMAEAAELDRRRMEIFLRFLPVERNGYREIVFAEAALTTARRKLESGDAVSAAASALAAHAVFGRLADDAPHASPDREKAEQAAEVWARARRAQSLGEDREILRAESQRWLQARR